MRFSVVIPVYNVEPYLRECLDSMLGQTCADWEAVCVDDGSTDGSAAILADYAARDSRFRIVTQANGGLSAARNTGLDNAQGDYILFLDSDDWLESIALQTLCDNIDGEDLLCFGGWHGEREEQPAPATYPTGWDYYNRQALVHHDFPFVCVVLRCYRRQLLLDNALRFREGILHEDNHFTPLVCFRAATVKAIPDALYHYRIRPGSIMTSRGLRNRESLVATANELAALFVAAHGIEKKVIFRALAQYYQAALLDASAADRRTLGTVIDWHLYRTVSGTKPRHRINYLKNRYHTATLFTSTSHPLHTHFTPTSHLREGDV